MTQKPTKSSAPPYESLEAWKACHELAVAVYRASRVWPPEERYGLTSQLRRAAISSAANLAEGSGRSGWKELRRFVEISRASLTEVEYLLTLCRDVGMIHGEDFQLLHGFVFRAGQLVGGLHRALRRRGA